MANESLIINLESLKSKLEKLANPEEVINKALEQGCQLVENSAKDNCPVDTGQLRASITHEVSNLQGVVGTNVEYAPFVEFGTSKQRPQPYLYPALATNREEITELIMNAIIEEVSK